jgi:hypothetical protein
LNRRSLPVKLTSIIDNNNTALITKKNDENLEKIEEIGGVEDELNIENDNSFCDEYIPEGWKPGLSKCNRKFFYNDFNNDRWYINYDSTGKTYFYNTESESLWELPEIFPKNDEDSNGEENNLLHFNKNFDPDLSTFKNLYSRMSKRVNTTASHNATPTVTTPQQQNNTTTTSKHNTNTPMAAFVGRNDNKLYENDKPSKGEPSSVSNEVNPTITTIKYSFKPPVRLNGIFKCVKLYELGGKRNKYFNLNFFFCFVYNND